MKIKVIDLLNMIAKGEEVPKEILYDNWHWHLELESYYNHIIGKTLLSYIAKGNDLKDILLTDIIIPEANQQKKIYKLTRWFDDDEIENARYNTECKIVSKLNELIDKVNEMSKND